MIKNKNSICISTVNEISASICEHILIILCLFYDLYYNYCISIFLEELKYEMYKYGIIVKEQTIHFQMFLILST